MPEFIKAVGIFYKNELNAIKKSGVQLQPVYEAFSNAWESIEERFHGELMHHGVLEIADCLPANFLHFLHQNVCKTRL